MNNEIPTLWLWVSGIFFLVGIILFAATTVVLFKIMQMAEELKPKVESLTTKVEALTVKMDRVADRVDETMISVKLSVDNVGGKAQGIIGSVESVVQAGSTKLAGIAPIITGAMAAYKIFMAVKANRDKAKADSSAKALPAKKKP